MKKNARILIAMPHYYRFDPALSHGSSNMAAKQRARIVSRAIRAVRCLFTVRKHLRHLECMERSDDSGVLVPRFRYEDADTAYQYQVDLMLCTAGENHLLDRLEVPPEFYHHMPLKVEDPRFLGYGCHRVLLSHFLAKRDYYDYFCYMEDDCILHDSAFFQKLAWFESLFGLDCVLQPHRYVMRQEPTAEKVFCDMELKEQQMGQWVNLEDRPVLEASYLGEPITFYKTKNPHAASFFLSKQQYGMMCERKEYGVPSQEFIQALESAATLDLMKTFQVYRASGPWASFFEMEHGTAESFV